MIVYLVQSGDSSCGSGSLAAAFKWAKKHRLIINLNPCFMACWRGSRWGTRRSFRPTMCMGRAEAAFLGNQDWVWDKEVANKSRQMRERHQDETKASNTGRGPEREKGPGDLRDGPVWNMAEHPLPGVIPVHKHKLRVLVGAQSA